MSKVATVNTFRVRKWAFFGASILCYFLPIIITTAILVPATQAEVKTSGGMQWTFGLVVVALNSLPFVSGILRRFFANMPMINTMSFVYTITYLFLSIPAFSAYADILFKIGIAADIGSVAAMFSFDRYKKNATMLLAAKTNKKMGLVT
jgi:hypothetical protein